MAGIMNIMNKVCGENISLPVWRSDLITVETMQTATSMQQLQNVVWPKAHTFTLIHRTATPSQQWLGLETSLVVGGGGYLG